MSVPGDRCWERQGLVVEGRFEPVDGEYVAACRERDRRELQEREDQLRRIAEQQSARAALQRRVTWGLSAVAMVVLGLLVWIVMQTRTVGQQTSLVLTVAAEAGADEKRFDQSLRLGVLAARASWLRPAHATAPPVLARAADASTLRALFVDHTGAVISAGFSPDGKRVVTASSDKTARVWDADTGKPVGMSMTHGDLVYSASFSPDGKRVVSASKDKTARVWNVFWSSLVRPENLIEEVCQRKLRGNVRMITEADVRAARILPHERVGEDVCEGVATVPTR